MRISTVTMFDQSMSSMNRQQSDFLKVSQQIASGRRVVNPSDDPQASSRAVGVGQAQAITQQYTDARISARNSLAQAESVVNSVADGITSAKTLLVQAASDTLSDVDRQSVASELRGVYETLIGQANATDGNGRYLFGGYNDDAPPFARVGGEGVSGTQYIGDTNSREQRIDASRLMPVSDNGQAIFQSVPSGAGYVARAERGDAPVGDSSTLGVLDGFYANAGSVTFTSGPNRVDPDHPAFGSNFTLQFDVDANGDAVVRAVDTNGVTVTYKDDDNNDIAILEQEYIPGNAIEFGGVSITLEGT